MEEILNELKRMQNSYERCAEYAYSRAFNESLDESDRDYCRGNGYAYNYVLGDINNLIELVEKWEEYYDEA